jgi:hypothetical protein
MTTQNFVQNKSQNIPKKYDNKDENIISLDNKNLNMVVLLIGKVVLYTMSYFSLVITTNYMSNVYINDTLIERKKAPSLINYGLMYIFINLILNSFTYFILVFLKNNFEINISTYTILIDIIIYIIVSGFIVLILSYTMQSKKFFLYEDDGLRANRAIKDIMMMINIGLVMIPYSKLLN